MEQLTLALQFKPGTRTYSSTYDMVKAATAAGFRHIGGSGLMCKQCKNKSSIRKFTNKERIVYACNTCGARY